MLEVPAETRYRSELNVAKISLLVARDCSDNEVEKTDVRAACS
jgi:hypothetical protein